jgi:hypothetical protein
VTGPGFGPMDIPPIPPETTGDEVITALGFAPGDVRAVVVTTHGVVGVAASIPDLPDPLPEEAPDANP